jgi:16S rRNA processing protein RimM
VGSGPVSDTVIIGSVVRAHGIHGRLRVRATGPTLGGLGIGERVTLVDRDARTRECELLACDEAGIEMLVTFAEIQSREDADQLRGATLHVTVDRLPTPQETDDFYVRDLIGVHVWMGETNIGTVRDVLNRPANDVLEIAPSAGGAILIPFTHDAVRKVDLAAGTIQIRKGLIDMPDPPNAAGDADAN